MVIGLWWNGDIFCLSFEFYRLDDSREHANGCCIGVNFVCFWLCLVVMNSHGEQCLIDSHTVDR